MNYNSERLVKLQWENLRTHPDRVAHDLEPGDKR